jgi:hypothetical protein
MVLFLAGLAMAAAESAPIEQDAAIERQARAASTVCGASQPEQRAALVMGNNTRLAGLAVLVGGAVGNRTGVS